MAKDHFVVIGNGPAGNKAAEALREKAPEARVTIISRECEPFYTPHRLPDYIAGDIAEEELYVHSHEFYKERDIKLRLGQAVADVDFSKMELYLSHKEVVHFSGLIIATGGKPRIPEPLQAYEDFMLTLKTLADAHLWVERLENVESVLIAGGDLTSLCFTKTLLKLDKQVNFILAENAFRPVRLNGNIQRDLTERLTAKGVNIIDCKRIKSMARVSENLIDVEVDGERDNLRVGAVGAFYGLVPDVRFLANSGLHVERGVLVDQYLNARYDSVYAAGDCAQIYHPDIHDYWVSIGYDNAERLGAVAAVNLVGGTVQARAEASSIFQVEGIKVNTSWWTEF